MSSSLREQAAGKTRTTRSELVEGAARARPPAMLSPSEADEASLNRPSRETIRSAQGDRVLSHQGESFGPIPCGVR